jgi:hypothetical protein
MSNSKYVVNIRGKEYLTVAGRVAMAHESGRLLAVETRPISLVSAMMDHGTNDDREYITILAKVKVLNEKNVEIAERLLKACEKGEIPYGLAETIKSLVVSEYEGIAKSPKEGSEAWKRLPPNAPERSNPTEVCATSALGRALGAAGFGDSESFASADEVAVAQNRQSSYEAAPSAPVAAAAPAQAATAPRKASATNPPSDKQKKYVQTLAKQKLGVASPAEFLQVVTDKFGKGIDELSALDVSNWIDELSNHPGEPPY